MDQDHRRSGAQGVMSAVADDVRASGFLREIVESSGLAGVEVAPGIAR